MRTGLSGNLACGGVSGLMEFAGVDKTARSKMGGVENAGLDISARCGRGGQCRSGLIGTVWQGWTMREK